MHFYSDASEEYARAAEVIDALHAVHRAWGQFRPPPPLKRGDMRLLGLLRENQRHGHPPITPGRLAVMLHQSPPGVSQKLSQLEKAGYIHRQTDKTDRRLSTVTLTPRGSEAAEAALKQMMGTLQASLDAMDPGEAEELVRLLYKLSGAMGDTPPQDPHPTDKE